MNRRLNSSYKKRAFSLIELVILLFLTGIILLMISRMISSTFTSLKFLQEKSGTFESVTIGLERLASEFREAVDYIGPPLIFLKVDPHAPRSLGVDLDDDETNPLDWPNNYTTYQGGTNVGKISYSLEAGTETLTRTVSFKGATEVSDVAAHVNDFSAERAPTLNGKQTNNNVFRIRLSLQEQRRVQSFETVLVVPGLDP